MRKKITPAPAADATPAAETPATPTTVEVTFPIQVEAEILFAAGAKRGSIGGFSYNGGTGTTSDGREFSFAVPVIGGVSINLGRTLLFVSGVAIVKMLMGSPEMLKLIDEKAAEFAQANG